MTLCNEAVQLVELGWAVFPCQPRSKEPVLAHGFKEATCDPAVVRAWWTRMPQANIGVACGASGLIVVDVDAPDGPNAWRALCRELAITVDTAASRTPTGGRHLFFRAPGDITLKNSTRRLGPGLDVRADGGYVIVPPAVHPNRGAYRWEPGCSPFEKAVAPLPSSLMRRIAEGSGEGAEEGIGEGPGQGPEKGPEEGPGRGDRAPTGCPDSPSVRARSPRPDSLRLDSPRPGAPRSSPPNLHRSYALAALRREAEAVRATPNGSRDDRLNRAAFALSRFVQAGELAAREVEDALGRAALGAGLGEREVAATIRSGLTAGMAKEVGDALTNPQVANAGILGGPQIASAGILSGGPPGVAADRSRRMPERVCTEGLHPSTPPRQTDGGPPLKMLSGDQPADFPLTDAGNGELIAELYGDRLLYNHDRSAWLIWDGARWRADQTEQVRTLAVEAARVRGIDARNIADLERYKMVRDFARRSENGGRVDQALKVARTLAPIAVTMERLDTDPWLLGCPNGTVALRTGALRPGQPEDLITLAAGAPFDPDASAPRWERFLQEICLGDDELVGYLRRAAGYSLTGVTREQVFFVCLGNGANGKSTFVNALHAAFGDYATQAAAGCFEQVRFAEGLLNDLAMLAGKRFVTAGETARNKQLHEQRIKQLTGGDLLTARFLYGEFFTYRPSLKIWMPTNYRPAIAGTDEGIWRRVREIPFRARFSGSAEKELGETLQGELPGILAWAVRGCLEWQQMGLAEPACVKEASECYRFECDPLRRFLAECVEDAPGARLPARELCDRYRRWCGEEEVEGILSQKKFNAALVEMGYTKVDTEHGAAFADVGLARGG